MSDRTQQEALSEAFPDEIIRQIQGMDYVPVAEVVSRLNRVLGTSGWSTTIVSIGRDSHSPEYVVAQISIAATIDDKLCTADGVGGKKIATLRNSNTIVDLGKDFKSAYSDALKKAAQRLGVGLHLARDDEAMELDVEHEVSIEHWNAANSAVGDLSTAQLEGVKAWWKKNGNGPKPLYDTMTAELFSAYSSMIKALMADEPEVAEQVPEASAEALPVEDVADMLGGSVQEEAPF